MCVMSTVFMMAWILFIFVIALTGKVNAFAEPPKTRLFHDPGLIMMDNVEGVTYFKHIYLNEADTWRTIPNQQPDPKARSEKNKHNFTHMDIDYGNRTFVMSDAKSKSIMALTFDEMGTFVPWTVYRGTSGRVNAVAIDWTTDVVYWTDEVYDAIFAASMMTANAAAPIIDKNLKNPYGIVVHPGKGVMFWTEATKRRGLFRATLGGRKIKRLMSFLDRIAYALYLDHRNERLYWVFTRYSEVGIESCNIHGKQREQLKNNKQIDFFIFDIDLYKDQFVSMERTGATSSMVMYNAHRKRTTGRINMNGTASGLRVLDQERQYFSKNICEQSRCPGVCTRSLVVEDCFCMSDLKADLDPNVANIYCGKERFSGLLVNNGGGISMMPTNFADLSASSPYILPEPRQLLVSSSIVNIMTSDIKQNKIYFYERQQGIIKSVRMDSEAEPEVVTMATLEVGGLAFDSIGEMLYWTDTRKGHIMVSGANGEFPVVLHENLDKPKAIAIHPGRFHRFLFWSEKIKYVSIWRSYLDGTEPQEIVTSSNWTIRNVNDMAVDVEQGKLYFCGDEKIYVVDFDGENFQQIYDEPFRKFTGITIMHEYIVLSDTYYKSSGLYAFHKPDPDRDLLYENLVLVGKTVYPIFDHGNWYGVTYHHHSNQPSGSTSCKLLSEEARCDQLCLLGYRGNRQCLCTIGYEQDGNKCTLSLPYRPYLLIADQRYQKLLQIRHSPRTYVDIPVKALKQPFSIVYDPVRKYRSGEEERLGQVYWSDLETGSISRSNMDGSYQEVLVYEPRSFITCMELDPNSRLLFYVSRPREEIRYYSLASSLVVLNIDTLLTKYIVSHALGDPTSIAVSEKHGYVYLIEQYTIWRVTMDGTFLEALPNNVYASAISIVDNYLYFPNVSLGRRTIDPVTVQILCSDIDGNNVTVLTELSAKTKVLDIKADENFVYWTNSQTRNVQYITLSGPYNATNVTVDDKLFQPSGLAMYEKGSSIYENPFKVSKCDMISCTGLCLTNPDDEVVCDENATKAEIDTIDTALCRIPEIIHGAVEGNGVDRIVPDGYYASVRCYPMHRLSISKPIVCLNGSWSHIPNCILEYSICGSIQKGYKVYEKSGYYFVYPEMTRVHVILIGGGGGGYDVSNKNISATGAAGDGGNSSFGDFIVTGGKGGTSTKGGEGGTGHSSGGQGYGRLTVCTTGGTAGQALPPESPDRPGKSTDLFAGAGGYSDSCTKSHIESATERYPGPGGRDSGFYGGGAGSKEGGTGGGGGWASKTFPAMTPKTLVPITVGAAGSPSYSPPGPGLVVVTWGGFVIDSYVGKYDVLNSCVLD